MFGRIQIATDSRFGILASAKSLFVDYLQKLFRKTFCLHAGPDADQLYLSIGQKLTIDYAYNLLA